jgi:hypothetical protein
MYPVIPESIEWIAVRHAKPDADETVLTFSPSSDERVWIGWFAGEDAGWYRALQAPFTPKHPLHIGPKYREDHGPKSREDHE